MATANIDHDRKEDFGQQQKSDGKERMNHRSFWNAGNIYLVNEELNVLVGKLFRICAGGGGGGGGEHET